MTYNRTCLRCCCCGCYCGCCCGGGGSGGGGCSSSQFVTVPLQSAHSATFHLLHGLSFYGQPCFPGVLVSTSFTRHEVVREEAVTYECVCVWAEQLNHWATCRCCLFRLSVPGFSPVSLCYRHLGL